MQDREAGAASGFPIGRAAIDVVILFVLTGLGGFIAGVATAGAGQERLAISVAVSNAIFVIIGLTIAAARYNGGRWRYLLLVTVLFWLASVVNVVFGVVPVASWAVLIGPLLVLMGISGLISYLFRPAIR